LSDFDARPSDTTDKPSAEQNTERNMTDNNHLAAPDSLVDSKERAADTGALEGVTPVSKVAAAAAAAGQVEPGVAKKGLVQLLVVMLNLVVQSLKKFGLFRSL
jgi:hypothetical protein